MLRAAEAELGAASERTARRVVERLALLLQASVLLRDSPLGEAFVSACLSDDAMLGLGGLPVAVDAAEVVARAGAGLPL